jgi:hypothetical protein
MWRKPCVLNVMGLFGVEGGIEESKLNVGDYTGMTNVGGHFPSAKSSQPKSLKNRRVFPYLWLRAWIILCNFMSHFLHSSKKELCTHRMLRQPFRDLAMIRKKAGLVRGGFGLNPAMNRTVMVNDIPPMNA